MGFFDHLHGKGSTAIKPQTTNKVIRKVVSKPSDSPRIVSNNPHFRHGVPQSSKPRHGSPAKARTTNGSKPDPTSKESSVSSKSAFKPRKRASPMVQRLESSDEDSDNQEDELWNSNRLNSRKRARTGSASYEEPDPTRRIRSQAAFTRDARKPVPLFVHGADIASLQQKDKFSPAFEGAEDDLSVVLRYPSKSSEERYQLVYPRDSEDYTPVHDILQVVELTAKTHLPADSAQSILDEESGLLRQMKKAIAHKSLQRFRTALQEFNSLIDRTVDDEITTKHLDNIHTVPLDLIEHILTQIYARTVSLKVESLRKYENGTDNVYGELLPRFVTKIFKDTRMRSDQVIVDLGSGVANVVLQAALEVGCESWGCEMMENACDLAELQQKEFTARCRLWGLSHGEVHLERGDFLKNTRIGEVLRRADVVLVNNQAFTPQLNDGLVHLFLDLKEGCQIVSLKSFVPHDHKINSRNFNSPVSLLDVQQKTYYSNCVSWTNAPGTYFVARKDSRKLKAFAKKFS